MVRFLLFFCVLMSCNVVSGQEKAIRKSTDVVVIKGKSYYLHTVEAGQTLFSICRAYGVNLDEVKVLNDKKDNSLSLYEVLKVPYTEPFVQQDDEYYYHKVAKGETLYSIARQFGIKPKKILKENDQYGNNESLTIGAVVRLPLKEIDRSAIQAVNQQVRADVVAKETETHVEKVPVVVEKKPEIVENPVVPAKNNPGKEVLKVEKNSGKKDSVSAIAADSHTGGYLKPDAPEYVSEVIMPSEPYVKVALLLPFHAAGYPLVSDTSNRVMAPVAVRSEQFLYFYEGILLAVDSLKHKGYKVDIHVFDTERSVEKMYSVTEELNRLDPDLIIGPVYASVFKVVADNLQNKSIPMVYPLSARGESFAQYPNFVQVNATFPTLVEKMTDWLDSQQANANIVALNLSTADEQSLSDKKIFTEEMKQMKGVHFFKWNFEGEPLVDLKKILLPDRENIIVLPTANETEVSKILPSLTVYADSYKLTVVGLPEWQTFTSVDHETYFKLNTKLFTYSYVDNNFRSAHDFAALFRKYFYTEPNNLSFKAFDMGLYFIEMAAKYRDRTLDAIEYYNMDNSFSRFNFRTMKNGNGKENEGFYIVTFGSDYQLKIEKL